MNTTQTQETQEKDLHINLQKALTVSEFLTKIKSNPHKNLKTLNELLEYLQSINWEKWTFATEERLQALKHNCNIVLVQDNEGAKRYFEIEG